MATNPSSTPGPVGNPQDGARVKSTPGLVDLGRALGRDMPASLKRTAGIAQRIRRVSGTPPAKKAG